MNYFFKKLWNITACVLFAAGASYGLFIAAHSTTDSTEALTPKTVELELQEAQEILAEPSGSYAYFGPFASSLVHDLPIVKKNLITNLVVDNLDLICARIAEGKTTAKINTLEFALQEAVECLAEKNSSLNEQEIAKFAHRIENYYKKFEKGDFDLITREALHPSTTLRMSEGDCQGEPVQTRRVDDRKSKTFRNIDVINSVNSRYLSVARNTVLVGNLTVGGTTTIDKNLTVLGNETIGGNLNVAGTITTGGGSSAFVINGGQAGPVVIGTNNATSLTFITNNTTALSIDAGGTTTIAGNLTLTDIPTAAAGSTTLYIDGSGNITQGPAGGGGSGASVFHTNTTDANISGNAITISGNGSSNITTSGSGSTVNVALVGSPSVSGSITAATGITATTGNIIATAGQVNAGTSISAGTTVTAGTGLTVSAGTTTLSSLGAGALTINASHVVSSDSGTMAGQVLTSGGTGTVPTFQSPAASSITIAGDTGGGLTGNSFTFTGGTTGLKFGGSSSPNTETLSGTLVVSNGGTGAASFTAFAPICGGTTTTSALQSAATGIGTSGFVLTSTGSGSLPTFQPLSSGAVTSVNAGNNIQITTPGTSPTINVAGTTPFAVQVGHATNGALTSIPVGATNTVLAGNTGANPGFTSSPSVISLTATTGNITATSGNIVATAGQVNAGTSMTAGNGITATTGNIVATTGNITATTGSLNAGNSLTVSTGTTSITGTTNINISGNAITTIGNTSGTGSTNIAGTTSVTGVANINSSGTAATNIGTGASAGQVAIGRSGGSTTINGATATSGYAAFGNPALFPAGTTALPGVAVGATNIGLSSTGNNLALSTNGAAVLAISSSGTVSITDNAAGFNAAGVVHNDASGNLSSSLVVNADITPIGGAYTGITDDKLATISTAGKVANSATTATSSLGANTIVQRDGSNNFSAGTITASLTGTASGNLALTGGTLSGNLTLPAGSATTPSLNFTGATTSGVYSPNTGQVGLTAGATSVLTATSTGVTLPLLTAQPGVVHNSSGGLLSSSAIVNADIANTTITNAKLSQASVANTAGNLVIRDTTAGTVGYINVTQVDISGSVTNPTDAATKAYVDAAVSTGIVIHPPAYVVSTTNNPTSSPPANLPVTIDMETITTASVRVLLQAQTDQADNGLWLTNPSGTWWRPTDFPAGEPAGIAYVLITNGTTNAGSSWLCSTPTAIVSDTGTGDAIGFSEFALPSQVSGANLGAGTGVYASTTGTTLNFYSLGIDPGSTNYLSIAGPTSNEILFSANATSSLGANTLVARDGSNTFAGSLTGAASLNVLKTGDTMTGALKMANQNAIEFEDNSTNTISINAPASVTSYAVSLPGTAPTANQVLSATATPTLLAWVTQAANISPTSTPPSKVIYVTTYGSDTVGVGDGSFNKPFFSLAHATSVANGIATSSNPITILIATGEYTENNSSTAIPITAAGISIVGDSQTGVIITPTTVANALLTASVGITVASLTLNAPASSAANGITLTGSNNGSTFTNVQFIGFGNGGVSGAAVACGDSVSGQVAYTFNSCSFMQNLTAVSVQSTIVIMNSCVITGTPTAGSAANTGISISGTGVLNFLGGTIYACTTGCTLSNSARATLTGSELLTNTNSLIANAGTTLLAQACNFQPQNLGTTMIDIQIMGTSAKGRIAECVFDGSKLTGSGYTATAIQVTAAGSAIVSDGQINSYTNGIVVGTTGDVNTTVLDVSGLYIIGSTNKDITRNAQATLNIVTTTTTFSKISITNPTLNPPTLSYFDTGDNNALNIGSDSDQNTILLQAAIGNATDPQLNYKGLLSSTTGLYGTQAMGYENPLNNPATLSAISDLNAINITGVTALNTQTASLNLFSDTSSPIGTTSQLRGWTLQKTGGVYSSTPNATAVLNVNFQNSDQTDTAPVVSPYTVAQFNGFNGGMTINAPQTNTAALTVTGNTSGSSPAVSITQGNNAASGNALTISASESSTSPAVAIQGAASNNTTLMTITGGSTTSGNLVTIDNSAPSISAGIALIVNGSTAGSGQPAVQINSGVGLPLQLVGLQSGSSSNNILVVDGSGNVRQTSSSIGSGFILNQGQSGAAFSDLLIGTTDAFPLEFETNGLTRQTIASTGGVTINAPTSGTALAVTGAGATAVQITGVSGQNALATTIGTVNIGAPTTGQALTVTGSDATATDAVQIIQSNALTTSGHALTLTGAATPTTAPLSITIGNSSQNAITTSNGAVGAPAYSFTSSPATGIYAPTTNEIGFAINGVQKLLIDSSGNSTFGGNAIFPDGTAANPSIVFTGFTTTGFSAPSGIVTLSTGGTGQVAVGVNGGVTIAAPQTTTAALAVTGNTSGAGNAVTITQGNLAASGNALNVVAAANAATNAAVAITGAANTADLMTITGAAGAGSTGRGLFIDKSAASSSGVGLQVTSNALSNAIATSAGTASLPAYSFTGGTNSNTGMYLPAANEVALTTNGAQRLLIDTNGGVTINAPTANAVGLTVIGNIAGTDSAVLIAQGNNTLSGSALAVAGSFHATIDTASITQANAPTVGHALSLISTGTAPASSLFNISANASQNAITATAGSATFPAYSFSGTGGNSSTGMYSPGTNSGTLALAANGIESIFINTAGQVGIGTWPVSTAATTPFEQFVVPGKVPTGITGSTGVGTEPFALYVQGRYVYVINNSDSTLQVFDASNPASPVSVSPVISTGLNNPSDIYVQGRYAYVVNSATSGANSNTLAIFDISNPFAPSFVASSATTGLSSPGALYVQGRYAYVLNELSNTLQVFDISNPASPVLATPPAGISTGATPISIFVQGRYAYLVSAANTLQVFDISNPALPVVAGTSATTGLNNPIHVFVQGRYAYVVNYNGNSLQIFDVKNPASPTSIGSVSTGPVTSPRSVYVQGRFAYVVNQSTGTLQFFDVSTPSAPVSVGTVSTGASPQAIFVQGRYAYVLAWLAGPGELEVFDLGGAYIQQLEVGGIETGTLATRENAAIGNDLDVKGGATIGRALYVEGDLSVNGSNSANNGSSNVSMSTDANTATINIGTGAGVKTVTIGSTNTTSTTTIQAGTGGIIINGNSTFPDGTAAAPSINFTGFTTTGFSAPSGVLTLSTAANGRLTVGTTGAVTINAPTANAVGLTVTGNTAGSSAAVALTQGDNALSGGALTITGAPAATANLATITQANASGVGHALSLISTGSAAASSLFNISANASQNAITVTAGSATFPAYSFSGTGGNGSTGMYSPGANSGTLALTANGIESLFINTSGQVGIGTWPVSTAATTPFEQFVVPGKVPTAATGSAITATAPNSVYVQGRYAYVVNFTSNTLQIFDVSNPNSPIQVTTGTGVATGTEPTAIFVQGRYAYVTNAVSDTLQIFDVSNPASPTSVGSAATGNDPFNVYVQGRYAYVTNAVSNTLQIFDVSNPASPTSVGSAATGTDPFNVYVQGRYAYVVNATPGNTLQIFDVSNPASPTSVGSAATGTDSIAVYVQGRYAYVINDTNAGNATLQIFDVKNPASPTSVGSISTANNPTCIYVQGRYAYVAINAGNFQISM